MEVTSAEKQAIRDKIDRLKASKFKQQTLPAWRPVPTAMSTMMTFSIFGVIFLATGIVLRVLSEQITEVNVRYDDKADCKSKTTCTVALTMGTGTKIPKISQPIYVYYQLDNFYQNHRRYVKSRDNEQLYGSYKAVNKLTACDPITKNDQLWPTQQYSLKTQA